MFCGLIVEYPKKTTMSETKTIFDELFNVNVNDNVEQKKGADGKTLSYLSWAWAWAEIMKRYPDASFTIYRDEQNRPYVEDPELGFMCWTSVTIGGITREMWLPVMDSSNRAMKRVPYEYQTKFGVKTVQAATMYDINKTIMRCLVKNLCLFGLGLYIYAGEDVPEAEAEAAANVLETALNAVANADSVEQVTALWQVDFKQLQSNPQFKAAVTKKGTELKSVQS
jgi:hypothetical protein